MFAMIAAALAAPCPAAPCTWTPDGRYLPIDTPVEATTAKPASFELPPGTQVVGVALLPTTPKVDGSPGNLRFSNGTTVELNPMMLPAPGGVPDGLGVYPLPLGTATKDGVIVPMYGSLVTLTVPAGATRIDVIPSRKAAVTVLGFGAWSAANAPFPYVEDHAVTDASWAPFPILPVDTLAVPRPAALGPIAPIAGRVRREGEQLVDDRGVVRFYGTNLSQGWDLPSPADSERMASAFATLGFNLVRLTFFPISRTLLYGGEDVRVPTADEWDRVDALLDAFARHGIRVTLPLVPAEPAPGATGTLDKLANPYVFPVLDPAAMAQQKLWITSILGHVNKRRGMSLADDPILLDVEIANESGVTRAWLAGVWEVLPEPWMVRLEVLWNTWLKKKYGSDAAIKTAWSEGVDPGLRRRETLGSILVEPQVVSRWGLWSLARRRDLATFHLELDRSYYTEMRRFLREDLGVDALIEGTQFLAGPASTALQAELSDIGDTHYQVDHPGGQPQEQERRPLSSFLVDKGLRLVIQQAVHGMPYFIGEYNQGWPSPYEYEAPLMMATLGARQGWSAMMWFIWRHRGWSPDGAPKIEGQMDIAANPVKLGQLVVSAALLRGGLIGPADGLCITTIDVGPSAPFPSAAPLAGNGEGQALVDCRHRSVFVGGDIPAMKPMVRGPVTWDKSGQFVVDAPGVSAVLTSGAALSTRHLRVSGVGAVSVVGLDAVPLATAKRWLLTVATRSANTGQRESGGHTIVESGDGPVLLAPWIGEVALRGAKAPKVTRLGPDGRPTGAIPVSKGTDGWVLALNSAPPSTWYVVEW